MSQIEEVRRTRALQRAARKRHGGSYGQGLVTVAVVGYTNAVGDLNDIIFTTSYNFIHSLKQLILHVFAVRENLH